MACVFFCGVFQVSLSTPGVFLPLFSVTRRTEIAFPLYEWVSRCCKTFFDDLRALTRYLYFQSWEHLMDFMIVKLKLTPPPADSS